MFVIATSSIYIAVLLPFVSLITESLNSTSPPSNNRTLLPVESNPLSNVIASPAFDESLSVPSNATCEPPRLLGLSSGVTKIVEFALT